MERSCFVQTGNEGVGLSGVGRELCAVDRQKRVRRGKGGALVAVDERMVLGQTLPQRGGFLDEIGVVAGLRPIERRLQKAGVPNAVRSAVPLNLIRVNGENFRQREIVRHFASFL